MSEIHKNIQNLIGKGKQGKVYTSTTKNTVIKVIPKKKYNKKEYFYAKKIGDLGLSPKIYNKKIVDDYVLLYMQKIDYTLFDWIQKRRTTKEYKEVYKKVIKLIQKLHSHNIQHGDIHVGNIGRIKNKWVLIDFGFTHKKGEPSIQKIVSKKSKKIRMIPETDNKGYEEYFTNILQPYDKLPILLKFHLWRIS